MSDHLQKNLTNPLLVGVAIGLMLGVTITLMFVGFGQKTVEVVTPITPTSCANTPEISCVEKPVIESLSGLLRSPVWDELGRPKILVEDKSYLIFWPSIHQVPKDKRVVYFDIGASTFDSSILWMIANYGVKFDKIYAYEASAGKCVVPEDFSQLVTLREGIWVSDRDSDTTINIIREIEEHTERDDFVVVKMDIEGAEWGLIPRMLEKGIFARVAEFFVELHFDHPDMRPYGWAAFGGHTLEDATRLLQDLRNRGIRAHYWP